MEFNMVTVTILLEYSETALNAANVVRFLLELHKPTQRSDYGIALL